MDLIQRLLDLRQSSTGAVVSESGYTDMQQRMHVPDQIEEWLLGQISGWRDAGRARPMLVMLSGNAGDGKSDLIERLLQQLGQTDDVRVIRDATHAETPTVDQMGQLAAFFAPFADGAEPEPQATLALIAMNTGMALSFLAKARDGHYGQRFTELEAVLTTELGLGQQVTNPGWDYHVVNLDRRRVLNFGRGSALFDGMLEKLEPGRKAGVLWDAEGPCEGCAARASCFVRTNVETLRVPEVRAALTELLWQAALAGNTHLSPRNLWDMLHQITTGGGSFFEGAASPCDRIAELDAAGISAVPEIERRLLHNLLFEAADEMPRGPVLEALGHADPALRTGRHGHIAESETFNDPSADSSAIDDAATVVGTAAGTGADPCLERLAKLRSERRDWPEDVRRLFGRSAVRRARVLSTAGAVADELHDPDIADYSDLLTAYGGWVPGSAPPAEVREFKQALVDGVRSIFGIRVGASTYFRQDSFSPASEYPSYAPIDLAAAIEPVPNEDVARGSAWLGAINHRPTFVTIAIGGGGNHADGWHIRGDLALFRLFRRVNDGYAASSVDLEAFFGLRYACERLGALDPDATELVIRDVAGGRVYRLEKRIDMGQQVVELTQVAI